MDDKIQVIVDYLKRQEKKKGQEYLGAEYEYIIVKEEDFRTVSYYEPKGIEYIFKRFVRLGWEPYKEGDYILGATKGEMAITTEPGGQFEYSNRYKKTLKELEDTYLEFLGQFLPILEELGYKALGIGYHPVTKIDEIRLLPKSRYKAMFDYFKNHGTMSHNMMKGTGALQLSIDFSSEEDYKKKSRALNGVSNIFYSLFSNAFFFESAPSHDNIREKIWRNTDPARSGLSKNAFIEDSYEGYAKYLLDTVAIFGFIQGKMEYTHDRKISDFIYKGMPDEELEHLMTMVFPDVRTKKFLEVRCMDSLPYPMNFGAFALIKGLVYSDKNVEDLNHLFKDLSREYIYTVRDKMYVQGDQTDYLGQSILEWKKKLLAMAKEALPESEKKYLLPLEEMVEDYGSLYNKTKALYKGDNIKEALAFTQLKLQ